MRALSIFSANVTMPAAHAGSYLKEMTNKDLGRGHRQELVRTLDAASSRRGQFLATKWIANISCIATGRAVPFQITQSGELQRWRRVLRSILGAAGILGMGCLRAEERRRVAERLNTKGSSISCRRSDR